MSARTREILAVGLITAACVALSVYCASRKMFWYDELQTVRVASLDSLDAYVRSSTAGFDLNPAPLYWATNLTIQMFGDNHVAARIPQCAATAIGGLALYLFLRRRLSLAAALPGLCLYWTTGAFEYSFEARSYAFVICGAAIFFLGLQHRFDGTRTGLAAVVGGLWIATAFHVTGLLALVAAAPALFVETYRRRAIDFLLFAAIAIGCLPIVQYPAIYRAASDLTFTHQTLAVNAETVATAYFTAVRFSPIALLFFLTACLVIKLGRDWPKSWSRDEFNLLPRADWLLMLGALLVPLVFAAVAMFLRKPFVDRYGLIAAWGAAAAFTALMFVLSTKIKPFYWFFAGLAALGPPASAVWAAGRDATYASAFGRFVNVLSRTPGTEAIAVSNANLFLQINRYAPDALVRRVVYLEDRGRALRYLGTDTINAAFTSGLTYLRPKARVISYDEFSQRREPFYVFECEDDWFPWQARALRDDGFSLVRPAGVKNPCTYQAARPLGGQ
jgi:hypothetical protein